MNNANIKYEELNEVGTILYVAHNNEFVGSILINDEIKEDAIAVLPELNKMGIKTVMLTGDNENIAKNVASKLSLTNYKANLLPQNKVEAIEGLMKDKKEKEVLCFVGDGINVQICANKVYNSNFTLDFKEELKKNDFIKSHLSNEDIENIFNNTDFLKNVPYIYKRVGLE